MLIHLGLLAIGCVCLYVGADRLIASAVHLGRSLGLSTALTGLVIVAVGTSLPELAVSLDAAVHGHGTIAVGSVVGSNIVNITLVLGGGAFVGTIAASSELRRWDMPFLGALTLISTLLVHRIRLQTEPAAEPVRARTGDSRARNLGMLVVGLGLLVLGAEAMVASGIGLARGLGVSEAVIALTVTAIGTGIPEVAATLVAVSRGHHDLALGNIVGSNLMNLGLVLGLSAVLAPMSFSGIGWLPLLVLGGVTLALWLLVALLPAVYRWAGVLLISSFGVYQVALIS